MEEVNRLSSLEGSKINEAKEVLAYEVTKLIHGEDEAKKAQETARALFKGKGDSANMPSTEIEKADIAEGMGIINLMKMAGLISSNSEGRRLIEQGGVSVNDEKVTDVNLTLTENDLNDNEIIIKKGKKVYHKVVVKEKGE